MSFRSSKGRDVGKEVTTWQSGNIGQGIGGAGGGTGGGIRFAGFNPEAATINNNGTPVGVTTSAWTQLSYTNAGYYTNESPGRYFDISVRTPDAGGGPIGNSRSGSISGTVYIEKDSQIFFRTISGGGPAGGAGAAIVNTNALEPESDRPDHTLLVAGGRGGNSPNQSQRGGGYAGGSRNPNAPGNEQGNGGPAGTGGGGGTQTAAGGGQGGNPGPNSGSPGNVWTGGSANSGGGGRSGGGGGGWYGGGGGANNGPGGPWGGGGGGSAYYAPPTVSVTNPQGLFVEIPSITSTTSQTTFVNGTFFEGSGFYYQHRDYPGDQAASTVYIRIAE